MCGSHLSGVTKNRDVMSDELIAKIESELLPSATDVSLTVAGEPFLTPKIARFVELAENSQSALQLNTNATDGQHRRQFQCCAAAAARKL